MTEDFMITYNAYKAFLKEGKHKTENYFEVWNDEWLYIEQDSMEDENIQIVKNLDEILNICPNFIALNIMFDRVYKSNTYIVSSDKEWGEVRLANHNVEIVSELLGRLKKVKFLSICNVRVEENFSLKNVANLEILELQDCRLRNGAYDKVSLMSNLMYLKIGDTGLEHLPNDIFLLRNLKALWVMQCPLKELPPDFCKLSKLELLHLGGTKLTAIPSGISKLTELKWLYLWDTNIGEVPGEIGKLNKLKFISFARTKINRLPKEIGELISLETIHLFGCRELTLLPDEICNLTQLKEIRLEDSSLYELPEQFCTLVNLDYFDISNTMIKKLPVMRKQLKLKYLGIANTVLERIPQEYVNEKLFDKEPIFEEGISINNTRLLRQPVSLFLHDYNFVKAYYDEEKVHLNETKVVFLGDGEAGKSHIIERILNGGEEIKFEQQSTPGIVITKESYTIDSENMCLQFWDFGGQEIMHSMHRFFLTERTLYVIVLNARDNTQDERAKYWLNNIKSFASGCPVILVLNKIDQNISASLNERLLRSDYPQIEDVIKMSALSDSKDKFNNLIEAILNSVKEFDSYGMEFPISWNSIKEELTDMNSNYITEDKYREICKKYHVKDERIQNWLLEWFHDLGVSFNYRKKSVLLEDYMVLKPQWITNAIYIILFNGKDKSKNGLMKMEDIAELLKNPPRAVVTDIKYKSDELRYILEVMRRFEISYQMSNDYEFIPMMCDKDENEEASQFINQDNIMEYYLKYEYLPNNVLHKLMIKLRDDIDGTKIWLSGVIFRSQDGSVSALVRMHDEKMEIFVRKNEEVCFQAYTYFNIIRNHLLSINKELNLQAENYVVYKKNGLRDVFFYDRLFKLLKAKRMSEFSETFEKDIPISEILSIVEEPYKVKMFASLCESMTDGIITEKLFYQADEEVIHRKLYELIMKACHLETGNTYVLLTKNENARNDDIRNMLSMAGYDVSDQTRNSIAPGGKEAGELDLLIKRPDGMALSVFEALCVKSLRKPYIRKHIEKVFQYDTYGNKYNYLVIYVEQKGFANFFNKYRGYLDEIGEELIYEIEDISEIPTNYAELKVLRTKHDREDEEVFLYHFLIHVVENNRWL